MNQTSISCVEATVMSGCPIEMHLHTDTEVMLVGDCSPPTGRFLKVTTADGDVWVRLHEIDVAVNWWRVTGWIVALEAGGVIYSYFDRTEPVY